MRRALSLLGNLILAVGGFGILWFIFIRDPGLVEDDLRSIERSIRAEYEKQTRVKVDEVKLVRETTNRAVGFAKIRVDDGPAVTKSCTLTKDQGGSSVLWRCE